MTEHDVIQILHKAVRCLELNNLDGFEKLMMLAELMMADFPHADELRGEMTLLRAMSKPMRGSEMNAMLRQAASLLKGKSRIIKPDISHIENHFDSYVFWSYEPGHIEDMKVGAGMLAESASIIQQLFGAGIGISEYYMAHVAYYRGELNTALKYARECYRLNEERGGYTLMQVLSLEILAGIGKHTMDSELWRSSYSQLKHIAGGAENISRACQEQAQVICAMLDMSLGCLHDVPSWLRTGEFGAIPTDWGYEIIGDSIKAGTLPCALVAHVEYLCYNGQPERALLAAENALNVFKINSLILSAYLELLRAACYHQLSKHNMVKSSMEKAVELIEPDGLWLIAAEFAHVFGDDSLLMSMPGALPEHIMQISAGQNRKLMLLRNEVKDATKEGLTKREQEIAELVLKGYSNAEIADELKITVRTVRAHLEHVYQKFNVTRRSKLAGAMNQSGGTQMAVWMK